MNAFAPNEYIWNGVTYQVISRREWKMRETHRVVLAEDWRPRKPEEPDGLGKWRDIARWYALGQRGGQAA